MGFEELEELSMCNIYEKNFSKNGLQENQDITICKKNNKTYSIYNSLPFNVIFLTILYTLQGLPIGMIEAFSIVMQLKGASYKNLGLLSFAFWPFSLKLIWAPIVDSFYSQKIGRRKSWLIPTQLILGVLFIYLSYEIDHIMMNVNKGSNILWFTTILTVTMMLAATQDIAVDGWAIAIFCDKNIHLASMCNSVGQSLGYIIANMSFLLLSSDSFCSKYLYFIAGNNKILTESQLLIIFGMIFIVVTTFTAIWIPELTTISNKKNSNNSLKNVLHSYSCLWSYLNLPSIKILIFHLLIYKVGFAAADSLTSKKLIEIGLDKNILAIMSLPLVALQLLLPIFIDRFVSMHGPLTIQSKIYPIRLAFSVVSFSLYYLANILKSSHNTSNHGSYPFPYWYHILVIICFIFHQIPLYIMYISSMGFFAMISDPEHGGAQMTLLNTVCNLGSKWPNSLVLLTLDFVTIKQCSSNTKQHCETFIDGFYVHLIICTSIGLLWYKFFNKSFCSLQNKPKKDWRIKSHLKIH